jgi:hypothetical protein
MPTTYAIPDGRTVMAATTWTGNGSTQSINNAVNGVSMQPDLVWYKSRSNSGYDHYWEDSVRGVTKWIGSSSTSQELTIANSLTSFNSNGFTLGSDAGGNQNTLTYVGWQWKAGGAAVTNTAGSITSQVSANTAAGFSVVTYTSTTGTVGHGLGVAPSMIIMKGRNVNDQWTVGHVSINNGSSPWNYGLALNATSAQDANSGFWNNTAPTSTVFSQGSWDSGYTKVAYCFAAVPGYSAFGSYTGNGSSDGPFVYLGFRPRWIMIKASSNSDAYTGWAMFDTSRGTYNVVGPQIYANLSNAEGTGSYLDILSNGFKLRDSSTTWNNSGWTYIYMAFAENPFKYANAR